MSGGCVKVSNFQALNVEQSEKSENKCELTGGYSTNARWDKGNLLKDKRVREITIRLSGNTEMPYNRMILACSKYDEILNRVEVSQNDMVVLK